MAFQNSSPLLRSMPERRDSFLISRILEAYRILCYQHRSSTICTQYSHALGAPCDFQIFSQFQSCWRPSATQSRRTILSTQRAKMGVQHDHNRSPHHRITDSKTQTRYRLRQRGKARVEEPAYSVADIGGARIRCACSHFDPEFHLPRSSPLGSVVPLAGLGTAPEGKRLYYGRTILK